MRVSIATGHHVPPDARAYAEAKVRRLEHHANLDEVNLTVERETALLPEASAEIVLHARRTRLSARHEAASVREAIDGVIDKADEQLRRHHDRATDRKGRIRADAEPPRP
ncbi:MAG: ribosome-associated translation inhibitor RaiA [Candidatus Dormibacteria bacterium]|jgi:ribosomal subunit interface protein